jgi:hypothetical protein
MPTSFVRRIGPSINRWTLTFRTVSTCVLSLLLCLNLASLFAHQSRLYHLPWRPDRVVNEVGTSETIDFVLVMMGQESAMEGRMAMKSILMHTSRPTRFHIICDEAGMPEIERAISFVQRPSYEVYVRLLVITQEQIAERARRAGGIGKVFSGWGELSFLSARLTTHTSVRSRRPCQALSPRTSPCG